MASDLDFSPPEVPEPTFRENLLRYGRFLGAIFQLICVLAILIPVPKSHEAVSPSLGASATQAGCWALLIHYVSRSLPGSLEPCDSHFLCSHMRSAVLLSACTRHTVLKEAVSALQELLVFGGGARVKQIHVSWEGLEGV